MMEINFEDISSYLPHGNPRQCSAYTVLNDHRIMEHLAEFDPLLAGTIPIGIDIEGSDLDIICCYADKEYFVTSLGELFSSYEGFRCHMNGDVVIVNFLADDFEIEIYGDNTPSREQRAFRHMLVEHRLLQEHGEEFRHKIIKLKSNGSKTEAAFAMILSLSGNPYESLLELE